MSTFTNLHDRKELQRAFDAIGGMGIDSALILAQPPARDEIEVATHR